MLVDLNNLMEQKHTTQSPQSQAEKYLKIIRFLFYFVLISGFLSGMILGITGGSESHEIVILGEWCFVIFENGIRTIAVLVGFIYTLKYMKIKKHRISVFRKISFLTFSFTMILIYGILPLIFRFTEFYNGVMPFPWNSAPFQGYITGKIGGISLTGTLNIVENGVEITILVYLIYQVIAFIPTLFLGRKWHCSMICTMNGSHAEAVGQSLPLVHYQKKKPRSKQYHPKLKKGLEILQIYLFVLNVLIILLWGLFIAFDMEIIPIPALITIERIHYFAFGLFFMSVSWIIAGGRGYCAYCPSGYLLGLIGRVCGQKITTNNTKCTGCGKCNDVCKMSIDICSNAKQGIPITTISCVGCDMCVDICPTNNLQYSTRFLDYLAKRK